MSFQSSTARPREMGQAEDEDRRDLMPQSGEPVEVYLARLRAMQDRLDSIITAVERGALAQKVSPAPTRNAEVHRLLRRDVSGDAPAPRRVPIAGLAARPRALEPVAPAVVAPPAPAPPPGAPATGDRRTVERRIGPSDRRMLAGLPPEGMPERRIGPRDRRRGFDRRHHPGAFERGGPTLDTAKVAWWVLLTLAWVSLLAVVVLTLVNW